RVPRLARTRLRGGWECVPRAVHLERQASGRPSDRLRAGLRLSGIALRAWRYHAIARLRRGAVRPGGGVKPLPAARPCRRGRGTRPLAILLGAAPARGGVAPSRRRQRPPGERARARVHHARPCPPPPGDPAPPTGLAVDGARPCFPRVVAYVAISCSAGGHR